MEKMTDALRRFLNIPSGYGSGYGYGSGDGYGYGYGSGYGSGSGSGDGYGSGSGYGYGYGSGYGYGYGSGDGSGDGYGSGSGYGYGSGDGYGYGDGYGLIAFAGNAVYYIDGIATAIDRVKMNLAKGFIVNEDLTTSMCYIAKHEWLFAHGKSAKEALHALQSKLFERMEPEEKIEAFLKEFTPGVKYPAMRFNEWHNKLTGSCEMGRKSFARDRGIDLENGMYTVEEFVEITRNAYGGEIIAKIEDRINDGA